MPGSSMRSPPSTSEASGRSPAAASSTGTPAMDRCHPGAPPVCEYFRQLPDALERAAELDAEYGHDPDLDKMPMYGVVFSFKDPFDTKDMRTTAGGDAAYDMDFPARDHMLVERLRDKGAIIFARRSAPNTTAAPAIPAAGISPKRCCLLCSAISARAGPATPPIPMTRRALRRWARVRARVCRSAPIW